MGRSGKCKAFASSALLDCEGCGHGAQLHSNEACEAIRCTCRVTQKMLASATTAHATVAADTPAVAPARRVPKRTPKKHRAGAVARDGTQAA